MPGGATGARRGTAEIELLLSVLVLITLLLLTVGLVKIGAARLDTVEQAGFGVLGNVATGNVPLDADRGIVDPVSTLNDLRPGLPNRVHVPRTLASVDVYVGNGESVPTVRVGATAAAIGPGWTFSAYPVGGADYTATQNWFMGYADESHAELIAPLLLSPSWPP